MNGSVAARLDLADARQQAAFAEASADALVTAAPTGLRLRAKGPDPFVWSPSIPVELSAARVVRLTLDGRGAPGAMVRLYFRTDVAPLVSEAQAVDVDVPAGDGPVGLVFDFSASPYWRGREVAFRIDLERAAPGAEIQIRSLELLTTPSEVRRVVVPAVPPRPGEPFHVLLDLAGESLALAVPELSTPLEVLARPHPRRFAPPPGGVARVAYRLRARDAGLQSLTLAPLGSAGSLTADLLVRSPAAPPLSAAPGLSLEEELVVVRDPGGAVIARLVPQVVLLLASGNRVRRAVVPLHRNARADAGALHVSGARRLDGIEVRAELTVGPLVRGAAAAGDVDVPWRVALGFGEGLWALDVALPDVLLGDPAAGSRRGLSILPGVEMLRGADLPDGDASLPDPHRISWPAAIVEQEGAWIAACWQGGPEGAPWQPDWSSPDVASGDGAHRLTLHAPGRPQGRAAAAAPALLPVAMSAEGRVVARRGPRRRLLLHLAAGIAPPVEVDAASALAAAAAALSGTFRGPAGLTLPRIGARDDEEYFDPRACLGLLAAGRRGAPGAEELARAMAARHRESPGGRSVGLALGLLMPDLLPAAVASLLEDAGALVSRRRDDGTWPPDLPAGCHHAAPDSLARTAAAVAQPVTRVLQAEILGLVPPGSASPSLALLGDPSLLPAGAQGWEFGPRVPEVLGAAAVADALALAAELGLGDDGQALDWLALGLTFFRLPGPSHAYACFPALGVTRDARGGALWYTHAPDDQLDWRGVSCPWVGLRFAASLVSWMEGARRRGVLEADVEALLGRVVRGALAHARGLSLPDGSLPDGFVVGRGVETEPLHRAPLDVAWTALALLDAWPEARVVREGAVAAAGAGSFARQGGGLAFRPAVPGPQTLLVRGGVVSQAGRDIPGEELPGGLRSSVIDGASVAVVAPV